MSQPEAGQKQSGVADRSPRQELVAILFFSIDVGAFGTTDNLKVFHDLRRKRNREKYVTQRSFALDHITIDVPLFRVYSFSKHRHQHKHARRPDDIG